MTDFGLDSLIAIEPKNWISRTLQAAVQTSEIVDATTLRELVTTVTGRSSLLMAYQQQDDRESRQNDMEDPVLQSKELSQASLTSAPTRLGPGPLPSLDDTLELYLYSVRAFISKGSEQVTLSAIQEFQKGRGPGHVLQDRLSQKAADPQIDGWLHKCYAAHVYLKVRAPVNPFQQFFGSQIESDVRHGLAERAAVVSSAALQFKQRLETGQILPDVLNEHRLCMSSLQLLFNSNWEPHSGIDQIKSFPALEYFMVIRQAISTRLSPILSRNLRHTQCSKTPFK